jgi:hypothetical protein
MATNEPTTARRAPFLAVALYYGTYIVVLGIVALTLFLAWPGIVATFQARMSGAVDLPPLPTAQIAPRPAQQPAQPRPALAEQPASVPVQQAIDAYNATAEAEYRAIIEQPAPVENTGQGAPVVLEQRQAPERLPAGDNVPTAEPLPQIDNSGAFGSKSKPVNIQETKTCLHGQVWTERGCKNPTPVGEP